MSIEDNKALILHYLALLQEGRADEAQAMLSEDLDWWVAGSFPGAGKVLRATLIASLGKISATLSEPLQFTIEHVTAEGDRVAVAAKARARKISGGAYEQSYHMLFFVRDGKISAGRPYLDTLAYAQEVHGAQVSYPAADKAQAKSLE